MTNTEKYLKDGVKPEDFAIWLKNALFERRIAVDVQPKAIVDCLAGISKPTLTEDERVILRNIDTKTAQNGFGKIKRNENGDIVLVAYGRANFNIHIFNHLFQFIKERRRISNRGIAEGVNWYVKEKTLKLDRVPSSRKQKGFLATSHGSVMLKWGL